MSLHVTCLFCDDIRHEVGGKLSLMGVYGHEISVQSHGAQTLEKLCILLTVTSDKTKLPKKLEAIIYGPRESDKNSVSVTLTPSNQGLAKQAIAHIPLPFWNIPIPETQGTVRVIAIMDGKEHKAGQIDILNVTEPAVSKA